eukprot:symbB.v1.2.030428.t1/scaffold3249.1/size60221/4
MGDDDKEKTFALNEVRKAWYIHEILGVAQTSLWIEFLTPNSFRIKERLDLGDVKEDLLSQLSSLQQQCPDAEVSFHGVSCFIVAECGVLRLFSQVFENLQ